MIESLLSDSPLPKHVLPRALKRIVALVSSATTIAIPAATAIAGEITLDTARPTNALHVRRYDPFSWVAVPGAILLHQLGVGNTTTEHAPPQPTSPDQLIPGNAILVQGSQASRPGQQLAYIMPGTASVANL